MERQLLVRDARDDAVLLVVGHPGPAALRRLRRDGRQMEHRVRERRVHEPADGLARQRADDADGVRVRAVGLLAEAEARAVLEACVELRENLTRWLISTQPQAGVPERLVHGLVVDLDVVRVVDLLVVHIRWLEDGLARR